MKELKKINPEQLYEFSKKAEEALIGFSTLSFIIFSSVASSLDASKEHELIYYKIALTSWVLGIMAGVLRTESFVVDSVIKFID
jgi:hypothetical protein